MDNEEILDMYRQEQVLKLARYLLDCLNSQTNDISLKYLALLKARVLLSYPGFGGIK